MSLEFIGMTQISDEVRTKVSCAPDLAQRILTGSFDALKRLLSEGKRVQLDSFATLSTGDGEEVTSEQLVVQMASAVGVSVDQARPIHASAFEVIRTKLLEGHEVRIQDFCSLVVTDRKAKIIKDPKTGKKMIAPAKKVLSFNVDPKLAAAVQNKAVSFIPSRSLQDAVEKLKTAAILLVVPEADFFVKTIEYHFSRAGWHVDVATGIDDAKNRLKSDETYLIILDSAMNGSQDLCELVKCRRDTSLIPMILMYPKGTDIKRADEFRICGDEQVIQPFEVKNLLTLAEAELARSSEEEAIFQQEVTFQLPTDDDAIDKANEMAKQLFESSGLSEKDQVALCAAFREGLGNAAQHGNKHRKDKLLEVLYLLDKEKITIAVTDSGNGFDHQRYLDQGRQGNVLDAARESHKAGKLGGLGIMLMLKCVDKLEYNDKGNVITLSKYIGSN